MAKMHFIIKVNIFLQLTFLNLSLQIYLEDPNQESNEDSKNNSSLMSNHSLPMNGNKTSQFYDSTRKEYSASVPSSFAILVNFGIDGRRRTLYSSNANAHECGDKQIWDPFNNQCRQLYCSAHFTLVDFKCVETNYVTTNITKPSVSFLDSQSEFVNVTLGFKLSKPVADITEWINSQKRPFSYEFANRFAVSFANTSSERIANVTYVPLKEPNKFNVNFILLEGNVSDNTTINNDAIVAILSNTISQHGHSFSLYDNTVKAFSIHTTISEFNTFCQRDSDMPIWYWNSEFSIKTDGNVSYLYVSETGRNYTPGQYMGNILYVQNIDTSEQSTPNKVNVSSNAVVCETQTLINESCPRILLGHNEYEWIDDGNKLRTKSGQIHDHYELAPNRSVFVCFIPEISSDVSDLVEAILSTVLIIISIVALTCVLVTYLRFETLRSTINGFNTINLAICLEIMQLLFITSQYLLNCRIAAIVLHYFVLLTMSWSSVIAYDMYRTFGGKKVIIRDKNSLKIRSTYWLIANISAAIIIVISTVCDIYDASLAPNYGHLMGSSVCWIRNPWATFLYFGAPLSLNIIINLTLYVMTVCQVRTDLKISNSLRKISRIPSDSSESSNGSTATSRTTSTASLSSTSSRPNQVVIFTRLGVLMGFTWIIALIIAFIPEKYDKVLKALSYLFVICNTSQGVVLFIAFLCNAKVLKLWNNLLFYRS